MRFANPFSPSFGISPPVLAGRRDVLSSFDLVFGSIRSPSYATLLWGLRGVGKTVLLNAVEDRAKAQGWVVVSSAAAGRRGLVDQIASKASSALAVLRDEHEPAPGRVVTGVSIMGTGIQTERLAPGAAGQSAPGLEEAMADLGDLLAERGAGLLVTVDEMHVSEIDEIREFGNVFQLVSRRAGRPVAFVGAALPELEGRLLSGDASTFLQRCVRHEIGNLRPSEAAAALRQPIEEAGGRIGEEALGIAVGASMGQPYLVQLIGSYVWDDAEDLARGVTADEVRRAAADASEQFGRHVHGPVWHRLSDLDKRFLAAMLIDAASSAVTDVGQRWGHGPRSVSTYRRRLLGVGLVSSVGRGRVAFADPTVRQFVEIQAAAEGFTEPPPSPGL
ncbi:MAG: AAA family ATPase [Acidimicrobiaceae bacterium]|nr:AAA family ATPase [Acidimicrobiaceae bacterium]MXZ99704.1 AAA family ATPase [Acidimicrobiaceae bacterium]MYE77144.1 AAA family ATPase [Acidimicrobiaceae bacterium]MYE95987.1 AAA family ATPase [Acidimicrobiaceae bacterium]MYI54514.1 AAA family ATPase [Acidimicrobiaceae bacterium]